MHRAGLSKAAALLLAVSCVAERGAPLPEGANDGAVILALLPKGAQRPWLYASDIENLQLPIHQDVGDVFLLRYQTSLQSLALPEGTLLEPEPDQYARVPPRTTQMFKLAEDGRTWAPAEPPDEVLNARFVGSSLGVCVERGGCFERGQSDAEPLCNIPCETTVDVGEGPEAPEPPAPAQVSPWCPKAGFRRTAASPSQAPLGFLMRCGRSSFPGARRIAGQRARCSET